MNVERVREIIIAHTCKQLKLYGIKRMYMDDIARELSISKRTIYKLFTSKEVLVSSCLNIFAKNGRELLQRYISQKICSPIRRSLITVNCYIITLYQMERILLIDLEINVICQTAIKREREFWHKELLHSLEDLSFCQAVEFTPSQIVENILNLFFTNCKNGFSFTSQLWMAYLLIRGLARNEEVTEINQIDKEIKYEWERLSTILHDWNNPVSDQTQLDTEL